MSGIVIASSRDICEGLRYRLRRIVTAFRYRVSAPSVSAPRGLNSAIDRYLDALCDARTRERAAAQFLVLYAVLWSVYWLISRATRDMNADMAEMVIRDRLRELESQAESFE